MTAGPFLLSKPRAPGKKKGTAEKPCPPHRSLDPDRIRALRLFSALGLGAPAGFTDAVENKRVIRHFIAEAFGHFALRLFNLRINKFLNLAAPHADDVIVMTPFLELIRRTAFVE